MNDSDFVSMMLGILLIAVCIIVGVKSCAEMECTPEHRGHMRVVGEYGGIVEICNGSEWIKAKGEVPK